MQKFTNEVHSFWTGLIDSDAVKFFVDLGSQLLKLVNNFGQMKTAVVAVASVLSAKKLGMFGTVFKDGAKQITIFNRSLQDLRQNGIFKSLGSGILESFGFSNSKQKLGELESIRSKLADIITTEKIDASSAWEKLGDTIGQVDERYKSMIIREDGVLRSQSNLAEVFNKTTNAGSKLGGVLKSVGGILGNIAITAGITLVSQVIIGVFDQIIFKAQHLKEELDQLTSKFDSQIQTANDHKKSVDGIIEEYDKLSKHVDSLGRNQGLTTEEFSRYHELTKQIANMFPNLISGYDDQGNAIVNLKDNVKDLTKAYEEEQQAAYNTLIGSSGKVKSGTLLNVEESTNGLSEYGMTSDQYFNYVYQLINSYAQGQEAYETRVKEVINDLVNIFGVGQEGYAEEKFGNAFSRYNIWNNYDTVKDQMGKYFNSVNDMFISAYNDQLKAQDNTTLLKQLANAYFETMLYNSKYDMTSEYDYDNVLDNDALRNIGSILVNNMSEQILIGMGDESIGSYVKQLLDKLQAGISNPDNGVATIIDELFTNTIFNTDGSISNSYSAQEAQEYIKSRLDILQSVFQLSQEEIDILSDNVGYDKVQEAYQVWMDNWNLINQIIPELSAEGSYEKTEQYLKENGINTAEEITNFFAEIIKALEEGAVSWDEAVAKWESQRDDKLNQTPSLLPFDQLFSTDSDVKDKIDSFKSDIQKIGQAIQNFNTLQPEDKLDIYETFSNRFPQVVNGGELTIDMLRELVQAEWDLVTGDEALGGVEGAETYVQYLKQYMDGAINSANGFKTALENIANRPETPQNDLEARESSKEFKRYWGELKKLKDYTRFFTDEQKEFWVQNTSGAENAEGAIKKYEDALAHLKFDSLTDVLADSTFQSVRENAEKLNEVFANGIVDPDEMQTLRESFSLTDEEILNGQAKELRDWFNGLVQLYAEKGGEAGKAWFGGWLTEQKNYTFDKIITSMFKDMQGVRSMSYMTDISNQVEKLSNAEKDLFIKNYVEGDKFSDVMEKIENQFLNLSNMSLPELLNNEIFSSLREEAEDLSSILQNGVTGEESQTILEKWGLRPEDVEAVYERIVNRMGTITDSAGAIGQEWFSGFLKTIFDQKRAISFSDIIDFEFSYEKDGRQISTTLGQYVDEIKSQADVLSTVISDVTSKTTSGNHKMWTDILGDPETLRALENIIPGVSSEIRRASNDTLASTALINKLKQAMSDLYGEYQQNASALLNQENLTKEAKAALEAYNQIIVNATKYESDMKNGLHDMADSLDKIYFDGAGESARSFGQALDDVKSEIDTLSDAYSKLMDINLREDSIEFTDLVQNLIELFPELVGHTDSIYELKAAIAELMEIKGDSVILRLRELSQQEGITAELKNNIDALINSFYHLGNQAFSMDHTINVLKNVRGELNQLAQFMNKVNETGLHLSLDASDDVYNFYPELLEKAEIYGDGTVKLNKEVYENFVKSKEAEIKSQIDAKIEELKAEHTFVSAKIDYYKARLKLAQTAIKSENILEVQAAIDKLKASDEVLKNAEENDTERVEDYVLATQAIADTDEAASEFQMGVSDETLENTEDNLQDSVETADSAATAVSEDVHELGDDVADVGDVVSENAGITGENLIDAGGTTAEALQGDAYYVQDANEKVAQKAIDDFDIAATSADKSVADASSSMQTNAINTGKKFNDAARAYNNIGKTGDVVQMGDVVISRKQSGLTEAQIKKEAQRQREIQKQEIKAAAERELRSMQAEISARQNNRTGDPKEFTRALDLDSVITDNRDRRNDTTTADRKAKIKKLREKFKDRVDKSTADTVEKILDLDDEDKSMSKALDARLQKLKDELKDIINQDQSILDDLVNLDESILKQIAELMANGGITAQELADKLRHDNDNGSNNSGDHTPTGNDGSNGHDGNDDSEKEEDQFMDLVDWIEVKIQRIEREISNLDKIVGNSFQTYTKRGEALRKELNKISEEMDITEDAYLRYMAEAESVALDEAYKKKVRDGLIDIELIMDENLKKAIEDYQKWYELAMAQYDKIYQLAQDTSNLFDNAFQMIQAKASGMLAQYETYASMMNNAMERTQEKGYILSKKYYEQLIASSWSQIQLLSKERTELINEFQQALDTGAVEMYSEKWYEYKNAIDQVSLAMDDLNTSIVKYREEMRQLEWDLFDMTQDRISDITSEAQFMIDLMSNYNLYNNEGFITNRGIATKGMHLLNYDLYMSQADMYHKEMLKINEELANDPNNTKLYDRKQQLLEQQQEMIKSAEAEKQAIKSLVQEGINKALDAMQKLINEYNEALDSQKSLYDYQKNINNQTKNIGNLQKQLSSLSDDDSEENRKRLQELKNSLEEAQQGLKDTEYEHMISETKDLLNSLYEDYSTTLNSRLDNLDALIAENIAQVNLSSGQIADVLNVVSGDVGYRIQGGFDEVFRKADQEMMPAVALYSSEYMTELKTEAANLNEQLTGEFTSVVSNLNNEGDRIRNYIGSYANAIGVDIDDAEKYIGDSVLGIGPKVDTVNTSVGGFKGLFEKSGVFYSLVDSVVSSIDQMKADANKKADAQIWYAQQQMKKSEVKPQDNSPADNGKGVYDKQNNVRPPEQQPINNKPIREPVKDGDDGGKNEGDGKKGNTTQGDGTPQIGDIVTFQGDYYWAANGVRPIGNYFSGEENAVEIDDIDTTPENEWWHPDFPYHIKKKGTKPGDPYSDLGWVSLKQLKGYRLGSDYINNDQLAIMNEGGLSETIVRPDGSILTPLAKGSMVLDHGSTTNLWDMMSDPDKFIDRVLSSSNTVNSNRNYQNNINITIPISQVNNFDDFMRQFQNSEKVEKLFDHMFDTRLNGGSKFNKYKVNFG